MATLAILFLVLLHRIAGISLLGIISVILLAGAFGGWACIEQKFMMLLSFVFIANIAFIRDRIFFKRSLQIIQTVWVSLALLITGLLFHILLARRLWNLDEDDPAYHWFRLHGRMVDAMPTAEQRPALTQLQKGRLVQWSLRLQDRRLERALQRGPGTKGWEIRRWNVCWPAPTLALSAVRRNSGSPSLHDAIQQNQ